MAALKTGMSESGIRVVPQRISVYWMINQSYWPAPISRTVASDVSQSLITAPASVGGMRFSAHSQTVTTRQPASSNWVMFL